MQDVSKDEIAGMKDEGDLNVHKLDSKIYFFDESNYHISNDSLYGKGFVKSSDYYGFKERSDYTLPLSNIESMQHDELNPFTTTLLVVGIILVVVGVGALIATLPMGGIR